MTLTAMTAYINIGLEINVMHASRSCLDDNLSSCVVCSVESLVKTE